MIKKFFQKKVYNIENKKNKTKNNKMLVVILTIFTIISIFNSCAVDSYTGSITVYNKSDINCDSVQVGNVKIGEVRKGKIITVYFREREIGAKILADGFDAPEDHKGKIDLLLNNSYSLELLLTNNEYLYNIYSEDINDEESGEMY